MKQHARRFVILILAQGACLALGLWLQDRFAAFVSRAEPNSLAAAKTDAPPHSLVNESDRPALADSRLQTVYGITRPSWQRHVGGELSNQLLIVSLFGFAWTATLQASVAWLVLSRAQEAERRQQTKTESVSLQRYNDLLRTRDAVIFGLAKLAESRDRDTGNHLERIAIYSTRLASALLRDSPYRKQITAQFVQLIGISSSLHDIGKVGVADSILMKPGRFQEEERMVMQMHVAIGGRCVQDIETRLGSSNFLQMAREIALCHHERWDGKGYPEGLAGDEIPLAARIVAVADVYDALSTKRVYKDAIGHRQCVEMIRCEAGRHFDPVVVDAFLAVEKEFEAIVKRCGAESEESAAPRSAGEARSAPGRGDRIDDDFSLATELLEEWTADFPDAQRVLSRRETDSDAACTHDDVAARDDRAAPDPALAASTCASRGNPDSPREHRRGAK